MALDTFSRISNQVRMRSGAADILLAQDWVNHRWRQIAETRHWSWLMKFGQFISPPLTNAGTVTVQNGQFTVNGSGTNFTTALIGQQFRVSLAAPIYTVSSVQSTTQLTLDAPFAYQTVTNVGYQIYQAYFTVPSDFLTFVTVVDPRLNWQLHLNSTQAEINMFDAQRASVGLAYAVVSRDYTTQYAGSISQPIQVVGSGSVPATTGAYQGVVNSVYTVQIVGTGASGVATYQWKAGNGSFSPTQTTSTLAVTLSQGVQLYFPNIGTYTNGNIFTIQCTAIPQVGLPRFEMWPHFQGQYNWPFIYISRPSDIEDPGSVLPYTIRGDVILEGALADLAGWPGNPPNNVNPYYSLAKADRHEKKFQSMVMELERQDDEIFETDVQYSQYIGLPFAPFPFADASWLQTHDAPYLGI